MTREDIIELDGPELVLKFQVTENGSAQLHTSMRGVDARHLAIAIGHLERAIVDMAKSMVMEIDPNVTFN